MQTFSALAKQSVNKTAVCMKLKMCGLNWQTMTGSNMRKYCSGNNQSDFRISGLRHHILCGHVIIPNVFCYLVCIDLGICDCTIGL